MHINITKSGIQCDKPSCDYNDVNIESSVDMIDTPWPKCGENLLTREDYERYELFMANVNFINSLPEHKLNELAEILMESNSELAKLSEVLQASEGIQVSFHKELKIEPLTWLK